MASPFTTPPNQESFSGLIDDVIRITGKPGSLIDIISYANLTIRECQSFGLFAQDLTEDTITNTNVDDSPFVWSKPVLFRKMRTVKYPFIDLATGDEHGGLFPKFLLPGRIQKHEHHYFYSAADTSGSYFVFKGVDAGAPIYLAYYSYLPRLLYYGQPTVSSALFPGGPYSPRPAYYDIAAGVWMYLLPDNVNYAVTTGNPTTDAAYRTLTTNWLLSDWRALVMSGTKAKVWTATQDPRAPTEYSQYKQTQELFRRNNGYEAEGF